MKLLLTAACVAVVGAALCAQDSTGTIQGSVRDSVTGQPIAGAELTLSGSVSATAATDADGAFRFENLPDDVYLLATKAAGYVDSSRGRFAETVHLKSAAAAVRVAIGLLPLADVEGRILGEEGEPLPGVDVYAGPSVRSTSDAEGRYRLENLVPASYRIALRLPYETRRETAMRDPETGETYGYADTQYYPDAYEEGAAIRVPIAPGMHLRKLDIRLRRTRLVALGGRIVEAAGGGPLAGAEVELAQWAEVGLAGSTRRPVDREGAFRFELVRPGHYTLLVYRGGNEGGLPYLVPVDAGDAGIEDLPVAVPPFARIQGWVKAPDPKTSWEGELRVSLYGTPGLYGAPGGSTQPVTVAGDGTFSFENVPPGRWWLEFQEGGLHPAGDPHRSLHVAKVRFGAQDGLAGPLTVAGSGNPPVEVTLSGEVGQLAGSVAVTEDDPPPLILIRRTEGQHNLSEYVMPRYSGQDGSFVIPDLLPGEYEVSAWTPDGAGSTAMDPQVCGNRLARVKIAPGETSTVRLEICNQ